LGALVRQEAGALLVGADPFLTSRIDQLVALTAQYGVPAIYPYRDIPGAGGLMSYGPNLVDSYRQAGIYAGLILKGANPAELPVLQPTKWEFVINLQCRARAEAAQAAVDGDTQRRLAHDRPR
jgi:putative ABC transport system substrate-binding protein